MCYNMMIEVVTKIKLTEQKQHKISQVQQQI